MQNRVRSYRRVLTAMLVMAVSGLCCAQTGTSEAWATNSSKRMEHQQAVALDVSTKASARITLDPTQTFQTIDGFGWMLNQGSAKLLMGLPADIRRATLEELFGADGLRASMVRVAIGACDLSESDYTYADNKDETLSNFAIAQQDLSTVVPVLQEIFTINPKVKVLACAWTAPTWMKSGTAWYNPYVDGTLKTEYYNLYADYFVKYVEAMAKWGIAVWGISVQNEPLNGHNDPSMTWTKEAMYKFIAGSLGPKLHDSGHSNIRIIAYDHNCDVTDFPIYVAKSKYVYGTAFHLYAGDISALSLVHNNTGKPVLFTEQYTGKDGNFGGDLSWHTKNVVLGALNNMSTTALEWNLCSDPNYSIHTSGGCTTCKGALTVNGSNVSSRNVSYYIIGHASRVVDPGAVRIAAATTVSDVDYAAFRNPDGSIGVIIYNDGGAKRIAIELPDALLDAQSDVLPNAQSDGLSDVGQQTLYATHTMVSGGVLSVRIRPNRTTPVVNTMQTAPPIKRIVNGRLMIDHGGSSYDVFGRTIKTER